MRRRVGVAMRATLAALLSLVAAVVPAVARAEPSRVLVVRERGADAVVDRAEVRLTAELRAAGFVVDERVAEGDADARRLVEQSGDVGAFATVLLQRAAAGASTDVWVADHVTHKTVVRRMEAHGSGDAADRSLALRIVELMRASLVEALVLPPPPPSQAAPVPPPPPPDVARWTREAIQAPVAPLAPIRLALGAAATFGGPSVGLAFAPQLRVAWRPAAAWSFGVLAAGPAFGARATGGEGSAELRQELALVEAAFEASLGGPVRAFVAAGAGAYHLHASGNATPPFTSTSADAWSALFGAGVGVSAGLAGPASLVLDVHELLAAPKPVVAFAADHVATVMSPGTLLSLSLAVEL
jgi:hypothetical protein